MKQSFFLILIMIAFNQTYAQVGKFPSPVLGRSNFIDIPVSPFTGTFSYSIPIDTITAGSLKLPVSIDYHSGGNKVGDPASIIGLGWNLNLGGSLTKNVRGLEDFITGTFFDNGYMGNPSPNVEILSSDDLGDHWQFRYNGMDGEPDIYTWEIDGHGGKFYIDRNHQIQHLTKTTYKFTFNDTNNFSIIKDDGTIYKFQWFGLRGGGQDQYRLIKVLSYDSKDSILLNYGNEIQFYLDHIGMPTFYGINPNSMQAINYSQSQIVYRFNPIESIVGFGNQMTFNYNIRYDYKPTQNSLPLKIYEVLYSNGSNCVKYLLDQDYFKSEPGNIQTLDYHKKRLRLKSIQKVNCQSPASFFEPPVSFEYYGSLLSDGSQFYPSLLDKNRDYIGFYNNANNNFPDCNMIEPTTIIANGYTFQKGNADRSPDFEKSKIGMLKKINLQTKGSIEYVYEQNDYPLTGGFNPLLEIFENCTGSCSGLPSQSSNSVFIDQYAKANGMIRISGTSPDDCDNPNIYCSTGTPKWVMVQGFNANNQCIFTHTLYIENQNEIEIPLASISQILANNTYSFLISVENCYGECIIGSYYATNKLFPGLRINQVKISNGVDISKDIIKNYIYKRFENPMQSSGFVLTEPVYGFSEGCNDCLPPGTAVFFSAFSFSAMNDIDGFAIGYENVKIDYNGIGSEKLTFSKNIPTSQTLYPTPPVQITNTGYNTSTSIINSSNDLISYKNKNFTENSNMTDWFHAYQLFNHPYRKYTPYKLKKDRFISVTSEVSMIDGVTTTSSYVYNLNSNPPILSPIEINLINSDGKTTKKTIKYSSQYELNTSVNLALKNSNVNIPYEETISIDGLLLDGYRTEYEIFTNQLPRPAREKRYERTWNSSGQLENGTWITKRNNITYGTNGKVASYTETGYNPTSLSYDTQMNLTSITLENHATSYQYFPNSTLLNKVINHDGTSVTYTYDELMRLKTITNDNLLITRTFDNYFSPTGNSNKHKITETTVFNGAANSNSNLATIINITYLDNLGRTIQNVRKAQSPDLKDIVTSIEYDKYGRIIKKFLPVESPSGSGDYVPIQTSWKYSQLAYENSPLGRITSETPPDWYPKTFSYGANNQSEDGSILDYKNNNTYPEKSLIKEIVTDANGTKTVNFSDKKGRVVMSAIYSDPTLSGGGNNKKTYYTYDLKDRLESVIVPGASLSTPDLNYYYRYNGSDSIIYKKLPSKGEVYLQYNNKNLLATYRDNNIGASKWLTFAYDNLGRQIKQGFASSSVNVNNPTFTELHNEFFYGTSGIQKGKLIKTKSRILGTSNWLETNNVYDAAGRLNNTYGNHHLNLTNVTNALTSSYIYDKGSNLTDHNVSIISVSGGSALPVSVVSKFDHIGRNTENLFKYNNGVLTTLSKQVFNHREELIIKYQGKTGLSGVNEYLQQFNFEYLTNGLLKKINQGQTAGITHYYTCSNPNPTTYSTYNDKDLFYLELYYDVAMPGSGGQIRKNGEISGMRWQTKGRSYQNYIFTYDYSGQMLEGKYYDYNHGPNQLVNNNRFTEQLTYDSRGNILTLNRYGVSGPSGCNSVLHLDQMTYNYAAQTGNRIASIADSKPNTAGATEFKSASGSYSYDLCGNIIADPYKGISNIIYNHLNKPVQITKTDGSKITFVYDGMGNTLTKSVFSASGVLLDKRDYIGSFEYVGGVLESVRHKEGRFKNVSGSFKHEYVFKDHIGNIRLVYTDINNNGRIDVGSGEILQESHYYPLGMEFKGHYWQQSGFDYRYKFNDIERIKDLDIGLDLAMFRGHDPVTGRWLQPDPMTEKAFGWTPYRFGFNNPVSVTDPLGLFESWEKGLQFARDRGFRNFEVLQTGDFWSVMDYDQGKTYFESDGTMVESVIAFITGAGKPKTNPAPEGMKSFESFADWVIDPVSNATAVWSGITYTPGNWLRQGYWHARNGNFYSLSLLEKKGRGWNFYKKSADIAKNSVACAGNFAKGLGIIGTVLSYYKLSSNPTFSNGLEFGVNLSSTVIWEIGAVYYPAKMIYISSEFNTQENTKRGIDPFWDVIIMK